ncbi:MAG: ATP-binding cassette domain-containing protein [Spirochaetales bacterium]|nr:ATP-binding cassette domain-containing protein [Spirochaetales bacterium]
MLLRARDLSLERAGKTILRDLSFQIEPGEIWTIMGPNGSGKTSLLHAILGLLPYQGTLELDCPAHGVGFVPQHSGLSLQLPALVREFLLLGFEPGEDLDWSASRALEYAALHTGLGPLLGRSIHRLSGGEKQRMLLARALINRPRFLILDEPTNEIDSASQDRFIKTLLHLNRSHNATMLIVTHDRNLADQVAIRRGFLDGGQLIVDGGPEA